MGRYVRGMNPTLRGFLIIALVALVIVVLQLYQTLVALTLIAQIAFSSQSRSSSTSSGASGGARSRMVDARAGRRSTAAPSLIVADIGAYWLVRPVGARRRRVHPRARPVRLRDVAHLARPAHLLVGQARARAAAPSSRSSASRISARWPTKIGVSRSV